MNISPPKQGRKRLSDLFMNICSSKLSMVVLFVLKAFFHSSLKNQKKTIKKNHDPIAWTHFIQWAVLDSGNISLMYNTKKMYYSQIAYFNKIQNLNFTHKFQIT